MRPSPSLLIFYYPCIQTNTKPHPFTQSGTILGSHIYRADDAPLYRRGNRVLLALVTWNIVLLVGTKAYYMWRNRTRQRTWDALATDDKAAYLEAKSDRGNRGLDFRFTH